MKSEFGWRMIGVHRIQIFVYKYYWRWTWGWEKTQSWLMNGFFLLCFQDSVPVRIKGLHIVNQPFVFNMVFSLFKPFLREKLRSRVSTMPSFYRFPHWKSEWANIGRNCIRSKVIVFRAEMNGEELLLFGLHFVYQIVGYRPTFVLFWIFLERLTWFNNHRQTYQ